MKNFVKNNLSLGMICLVFSLSFAITAKAAKFKVTPKGEQLLFEQTLLTVKAGEEVTLTFDNISSMPHNWVLVKPGASDQVAKDSLAAGADKGWLAKGPNVLASTKMVEPKNADTIKFKAPTTPGDYPYICTFPGHAMLMKGILKVQ